MFTWLLRLFTRPAPLPVQQGLSAETRSRLLAVGMAAAERTSALR